MLGESLQRHLGRIAQFHAAAKGGEEAPEEAVMNAGELQLYQEMKAGVQTIAAHVGELNRPRELVVANGTPKGSWAHVYYVSFHDPSVSTGPTEGFYPVFLLSVDHKTAWLSLIIAASSEGISGRGGWSGKRGLRLIERAKLLGAHLDESSVWKKGPIRLGATSTYLHKQPGSTMSAGRGYECGSIIAAEIAAPFDGANLRLLLSECFGFFDAVGSGEAPYLETITRKISSREDWEQENAAILGAEAERYFLSWSGMHLVKWGEAKDLTGKVGLGYDVHFPMVDYKLEVKGFRGEIEDIRLTPREREAAERFKEGYYLALVYNLRGEGEPQVRIISDPFGKLGGQMEVERRIQITYSLSARALKAAPTTLV